MFDFLFTRETFPSAFSIFPETLRFSVPLFAIEIFPLPLFFTRPAMSIPPSRTSVFIMILPFSIAILSAGLILLVLTRELNKISAPSWEVNKAPPLFAPAINAPFELIATSLPIRFMSPFVNTFPLILMSAVPLSSEARLPSYPPFMYLL